jgi:hypothetical protein
MTNSSQVDKHVKQFVNHLLTKRCDSQLTVDEIEELNSKFYDPVLVAKMAYKKALEAKKQGRQFTQDEMVKLYQTQSVNSDESIKKTRGHKKKVDQHRATPDNAKSNREDSSDLEPLTNEPLKNQNSVTKNDKNEDILPLKSS